MTSCVGCQPTGCNGRYFDAKYKEIISQWKAAEEEKTASLEHRFTCGGVLTAREERREAEEREQQRVQDTWLESVYVGYNFPEEQKSMSCFIGCTVQVRSWWKTVIWVPCNVFLGTVDNWWLIMIGGRVFFSWFGSGFISTSSKEQQRQELVLRQTEELRTYFDRCFWDIMILCHSLPSFCGQSSGCIVEA